MARKRWEVAPEPMSILWTVRCAGMLVTTRLFKYRAVEFAAGECNLEWEKHGIKSELVIKGRDGQIKDSRTYGDDPRSIKG